MKINPVLRCMSERCCARVTKDKGGRRPASQVIKYEGMGLLDKKESIRIEAILNYKNGELESILLSKESFLSLICSGKVTIMVAGQDLSKKACRPGK